MIYLSADGRELWVLAAPPSLLFGTADNGAQGIDQGTIATPVRIIGTGSGVVTCGGIPRQDMTVRVRCTVGGEINDNSTVNPSATVLPAFEVSADDGVTWLPVQTVSDHRNRAEILVAKLGLTVRFANGSVAPSFVIGDVWQFACSASETVKALVPAVCADMDDYLNATYDLPLSAAAPNFVLKACELLRWYIIKQLGLAHDQSMAAYEPKEVTQWLANHQAGRMSRPKDLGITEKPPGTSFVYSPAPRVLRNEFPI